MTPPTPSPNSISKTYPAWIFDGSAIADPFGYGERAVRFLRALKHPKSRLPGRAFQLDPWMERVARRIYGPAHPDGRRVVRTAVLLLPRGNRKTSLGAALALLHTFGPERIPKGQAIGAAADRKQARIAFEEALGIVDAVPQLAGAGRRMDYKNRLIHPRSGAIYEAISADAGTQHGRTPNFALVDELHAWRKRELWDVIRTGLVKVPGSLMIVITTAGRGQDNLASDIVDYARKVATGAIDDPATLPVLFETPPDADWRDESVWRAVNPGLAHGYPDIEGLRQLAREAENRPFDREAFRQLHLNVWLDSSAAPFVDMAVYDEGAGPVDLDELAALPCWLAVDLSSNVDLTVIEACWRDGDRFLVHPWFFCPRDNLRERQDRTQAPYVDWAEQGLITATPGNVVDFSAVESCIIDLCDRFDVREIAFDPHLARQVQPKILEAGLPAVDFRQVPSLMMPALAELERAIVGRRFVHGGHPVLRYCFANAEVERNRQGHLVRFVKSRKWLSIDGAVAAAMAVSRAAAGDVGSWLDDVDVEDFFASLRA